MGSARVLEASVRLRSGQGEDFARRVVAAFRDVPRIDAVETLDGVVVATIWYADLDQAASMIAAISPEGVVWSEPSIRYRHETVQVGGRARQVTLEPMMLVEVSSPAEFIGNVIGDLSARRGLVMGHRELEAGAVQVSAEVPLSELRGYDLTLAQMTGSAGVVSVSTLKYNEAPRRPGPPDEPASMALRA